MGHPNWAQLKAQGRVKDIGLPWSPEEAKAVFELGVPAAFVRRGCLTTEAYEALKSEDEEHKSKHGELPVEAMSHDELLKKAREQGVQVTNDATEEVLRALVPKVAKKPKKK